MLRALFPGLAVLCIAPRVGAEEMRNDVDVRYERVLAAFDRGRPAAKLWWVAWTAGYSAVTLGEGALALATHDRGLRIDSVVGAVEGALGVGAMFAATPRTPIWAARSLRAMDGRTLRARVLRLRRAETLLKQSAEEEESARAWYSQLVGGAVNLAAPVVLWIGYQRFASGWISLTTGLAALEAQILTQPTAAIRAWRSYNADVRPGVSWAIVPIPGGAMLKGTF